MHSLHFQYNNKLKVMKTPLCQFECICLKYNYVSKVKKEIKICEEFKTIILSKGKEG